MKDIHYSKILKIYNMLNELKLSGDINSFAHSKLIEVLDIITPFDADSIDSFIDTPTSISNLENEETWVEMETDIDFSQHNPVHSCGSLHIQEDRYFIDGETWRLLYYINEISGNPIIEKLL